MSILNIKKMNILVLGGCGFIGRNLIKALQDTGHKIFCYDVKPYPDKGECISICGNLENCSILESIMPEIDIVYHLISTTTPKTSDENPEACIQSNVIGSLKMIEMSAKNKIKHFIFASSGGTVYGEVAKTSIKETDPTDPQCTYGISKLTIEKLIQMYGKQNDMKYSIMRLANPYGPLQSPARAQGAISVFLNKSINDDTITIWGDGTVIRDYIFIDDVISALMSPLNKIDISGVYNVGTGIGYSLNDLISVIEKINSKNLKVEYTGSRDIDVKSNVLNIEKIKETHDWEPRFGLNEGIRITKKWLELYLEQLD